MTVTKDQVLDKLRRVKGPDLDGNIVDLGLVSEILIKDGRGSISRSRCRRSVRRSWSRCARRPRRSSTRSRALTGVTAVLTADAAHGQRPAPRRVRTCRSIRA